MDFKYLYEWFFLGEKRISLFNYQYSFHKHIYEGIIFGNLSDFLKNLKKIQKSEVSKYSCIECNSFFLLRSIYFPVFKWDSYN